MGTAGYFGVYCSATTLYFTDLFNLGRTSYQSNVPNKIVEESFSLFVVTLREYQILGFAILWRIKAKAFLSSKMHFYLLKILSNIDFKSEKKKNLSKRKNLSRPFQTKLQIFFFYYLSGDAAFGLHYFFLDPFSTLY